MVEEVRGRMPMADHVRLRAWLLLRAAGHLDLTAGRDESVVVVQPVVVLRHPDVARRVGLEPGSPGLAAAECFLERQGYIRPVTVGTEPRAFVITDEGRMWLEQDRWTSSRWRMFG
jgi:hypothetical protein